MRTIKTWWLIAAFLGGVATAMWAEELILRVQDDHLQVTAPRFHFITGRSQERLFNAATVPFDFRLTVSRGAPGQVFRQQQATFVISYDLFEERYRVDRLTGTRKTVSHLTSSEAEAWCFQEISGADLSGVGPTEPLWVQLDIRALNERDSSLFGKPNITEDGINLTKPLESLLERLSRPPADSQNSWTLEAGPLTLEQLRRGRG